jgi:hypothetical protein
MLNIRAATLDDLPEILKLIRELTMFEKAPQEAVARSEDLLGVGFLGNPKFAFFPFHTADPRCLPGQGIVSPMTPGDSLLDSLHESQSSC